jgi:DNA polymerase-4
VVLKIRFADFTTITRSRTLDAPTDVGQVLYDTAVDLYAALRLQRARIRLVGVRLEGLADLEGSVEQLTFDDGSVASPVDRRAAEVAADRLRERFGQDVVRPARLWTDD